MTSPVGMQDISDAVQYSSGDLGTLIQNGVINKWARYKPITSSRVGYVRESDRQAADFGISASEYSSPLLAADLLNGWSYSPPISGYYRMFDFVKVSDAGVPSTTVGYTQRDVAPCRGFYSASATGQLTHYVYNRGAQTMDDINFYAITTGDEWGIGFAEMGGLANWYLCIAVAVIKNNVTTVYIVTSTQNIGAGVSDPSITTWQTVPIPKNNTIFSTAATYGACAVLCDTCVTSWTDYTQAVQHGSAKFMPLPVENPAIANFDFEVFSGTYRAWVGGAYRVTTGSLTDRRKVWYTLYGTNNTGQTIPSSSLTIEVQLYAYNNGVRTDLGNPDIYNASSTPSSSIPDTGGSTVMLNGGSDVYLGSQQIPSCAAGTLHIDCTGYDTNHNIVFGPSTTQVADDPQPIIDIE